MFQYSRIDCILIWGHGMQYFNDILKDIRGHKDFKILKIQKYKIQNMKKFVKAMYAFDYAPFWHLKEKTKYLMKTPSEVCFIFIENLNLDEEYLGEGDFRHKESMTLKSFKENLRDKYNPYENAKRSHNHVIHATDSQEQANHMIKYLGNKDISIFCKDTTIVDIPYYIKGYIHFDFKMVSVDDIYCNIIDGISWDNYHSTTVKVIQSPQYKGLTKDMNIYQNYIDKFIGGSLQEDYNF